jgi:hypothetical protein
VRACVSAGGAQVGRVRDNNLPLPHTRAQTEHMRAQTEHTHAHARACVGVLTMTLPPVASAVRCGGPASVRAPRVRAAPEPHNARRPERSQTSGRTRAARHREMRMAETMHARSTVHARSNVVRRHSSRRASSVQWIAAPAQFTARAVRRS